VAYLESRQIPNYHIIRVIQLNRVAVLAEVYEKRINTVVQSMQVVKTFIIITRSNYNKLYKKAERSQR